MAHSDQTRALPKRRGVSSLKTAFGTLPYIAIAAVFCFAFAAGLMHYARILRMQDLTGSNGDYSNYAEIARVAANGGKMYLDYWTTKPPGVFIYLTPFVLLLGNTVLAINAATVLIIVVFVLSLTALAYQITRSPWAALAAAALALIYSMEKNGPETTLVMSTFGTLAALCAVVGRGRLAYMVGAGMLFAAGVLTKQTIAIELPVLLALAIYYAPGQRVKAAAGVLVGGAALAAVVVVWALSQGIFEAMWSRAFTLNAQYVLAEDGRWHFREDFNELFARNFLHFTMRYLTPLLVLAAVSLLIFAVRRPQKRALFMIVLAWAALAFLGASAGRAFKTHYYFEIVPPFVLLFALALARADKSVWQWVAAGALAFAVGNFHWRYADISAQLDRTRMREERPVLNLIARQTDADDCLWTWGQMSYINYLSGRDSCASPALNGFMMDETAFPIAQTRVEYMNEIIDAMPALHIMTDLWGYFPELEKYADRYRGDLIFENDTYQIYTVDRSMWHPTDIRYGGEVALIGYDLPPQNAYCPGDTLPLAMTWRQLRPLSGAYHMFAQILTEDEMANRAGYDGALAQDRPLETWQTSGEVILGQPFTLALPPDMQQGTYKLIVGVYDTATGQRLDATGANGQTLGSYAALETIMVGACE